jgi:hypothetical protein
VTGLDVTGEGPPETPTVEAIVRYFRNREMTSHYDPATGTITYDPRPQTDEPVVWSEMINKPPVGGVASTKGRRARESQFNSYVAHFGQNQGPGFDFLFMQITTILGYVEGGLNAMTNEQLDAAAQEFDAESTKAVLEVLELAKSSSAQWTKNTGQNIDQERVAYLIKALQTEMNRKGGK